MSGEGTSEFSREIDLGALPESGKRFSFEATKEERAAVARRLGVPAVAALRGEARVAATRSRIDVEGRIDATLVRECVASLEHVEETVADAFKVEFLRREPEAAPDADDDAWLDAPEVWEHEQLDVGELLVQQVSLAMDPFPRKEGAASLADQFGSEEEQTSFASVLAKAIKTEENQ